ncbi:hypothetical protein PRIC2_006449 [Phytophthora ramorum]
MISSRRQSRNGKRKPSSSRKLNPPPIVDFSMSISSVSSEPTPILESSLSSSYQKHVLRRHHQNRGSRRHGASARGVGVPRDSPFTPRRPVGAVPELFVTFRHVSLAVDVPVSPAAAQAASGQMGRETLAAQQLPTITNHVRGILGALTDSKTFVRRQILKNVTGAFTPGSMTLLLGRSGSGKSMLLKLLSGGFDASCKSVTLDGEVSYNGLSRQELKAQLPQCVAYVPQQDTHLPVMTVKETLDFAFECRAINADKKPAGTICKSPGFEYPLALPMTFLGAERDAVTVTRELGLTRCQGTIVGNDRIRGVSGASPQQIRYEKSHAPMPGRRRHPRSANEFADLWIMSPMYEAMVEELDHLDNDTETYGQMHSKNAIPTPRQPKESYAMLATPHGDEDELLESDLTDFQPFGDPNDLAVLDEDDDSNDSFNASQGVCTNPEEIMVHLTPRWDVQPVTLAFQDLRYSIMVPAAAVTDPTGQSGIEGAPGRPVAVDSPYKASRLKQRLDAKRTAPGVFMPSDRLPPVTFAQRRAASDGLQFAMLMRSIPDGYKWLFQLVPHRYTFEVLTALVLGDCPDEQLQQIVNAAATNTTIDVSGWPLGCQLLTDAPPAVANIPLASYIDEVFGARREDTTRSVAVVVGILLVMRLATLVVMRVVNHQKR